MHVAFQKKWGTTKWKDVAKDIIVVMVRKQGWGGLKDGVFG